MFKHVYTLIVWTDVCTNVNTNVWSNVWINVWFKSTYTYVQTNALTYVNIFYVNVYLNKCMLQNELYICTKKCIQYLHSVSRVLW